jgi:hypothetical protein
VKDKRVTVVESMSFKNQAAYKDLYDVYVVELANIRELPGHGALRATWHQVAPCGCHILSSLIHRP